MERQGGLRKRKVMLSCQGSNPIAELPNSEEQQSTPHSQGSSPIPHGKECSMCGDVGIYQDLFRCKKCLSRYQHLYCSRSYPNLGSEICICNWCLHTTEEDQHQKKADPDHDTNYGDETTKQKGGYSSPIVNSEGNHNRPRNAFEFLLQIAEVLPAEGSDRISESGLLLLGEEGGRGTSESVTSGSSRDETDTKAGHHVPKRQRRYTQNREKKKQEVALGKWQRIAKSRLQPDPAPSRGIHRRYKLLADVLC